jgi:V8-like Glu-specific endopeptidase
VIRGGGVTFAHDCSTLGGSSGSPVLDAATGLVIGVHKSGMFAVRNGAVASAALFSDPRLRETVGGERFA